LVVSLSLLCILAVFDDLLSKMVIPSPFAAFAAFAAMFATVAAQSNQLTVISPGGPDLWWVADSQNDLVWSCQSSPYLNFTVLVANPNPSILPAPIAIIAIEENYICSQEITQDMSNQPPAVNYTVQFANPLNNTDIYAESQPFEIKALGASYPPASATPTDAVSGSSSATGTGASATSTKNSSPSNMQNSVAYGVALGAAVLGLITA
jgi:hypothetical protein